MWFWAFIVSWSLWMLGCIWFTICNHRTYKDRMKILASWRGLEYPAMWKAQMSFDSIPYNRHLWYLMTFRKPQYPPYSRE